MYVCNTLITRNRFAELTENVNNTCQSYRTVQWHNIDKLPNDTVPIHTFITTNHQVLFIYNRTKITG